MRQSKRSSQNSHLAHYMLTKLSIQMRIYWKSTQRLQRLSPKSHVLIKFCGYLTTLLNVRCPLICWKFVYSCYKYDYVSCKLTLLVFVQVNISIFWSSLYLYHKFLYLQFQVVTFELCKFIRTNWPVFGWHVPRASFLSPVKSSWRYHL